MSSELEHDHADLKRRRSPFRKEDWPMWLWCAFGYSFITIPFFIKEDWAWWFAAIGYVFGFMGLLWPIVWIARSIGLLTDVK